MELKTGIIQTNKPNGAIQRMGEAEQLTLETIFESKPHMGSRVVV